MQAPGNAAATARPPACASLDAIFRANVRRTPEIIAIADTAIPASARAARQLTYAELDAAADALAARLQHLGIASGSAVALQLPNSVETMIALLGIVRAGCVAAPLPLLWGQADCARALALIGAAALLVLSADRGDTAARALRIAAETATLRYVCDFGGSGTDGIVPIGDILADAGAGKPGFVARAAAEPAVITFDVGVGGPIALPRSEAELLAGGLAVVLQARVPPRATLLGTLLLSSYAALATTVVPWLLAGGTLLLHHPFDPAVLEEQADACDVAVVPAALVPPLADACILGGRARPELIAVWRAPERYRDADLAAAAACVDVLAFGEFALVPLRRNSDGSATPLCAGALTVPSGDPSGTPVLTLSRSRRGTLQVEGAMLRQPTDTGYPCRFDPTSGTLSITGAPAGITQIGGYRLALHEVQDLAARAAPEAMLAALPDLLAGQRLAGSAGDLHRVRRALAEAGANGLIVAAFRPRQPAT